MKGRKSGNNGTSGSSTGVQKARKLSIFRTVPEVRMETQLRLPFHRTEHEYCQRPLNKDSRMASLLAPNHTPAQLHLSIHPCGVQTRVRAVGGPSARKKRRFLLQVVLVVASMEVAYCIFPHLSSMLSFPQGFRDVGYDCEWFCKRFVQMVCDVFVT